MPQVDEPRCTWQSIRPGMTVRCAASMTSAALGMILDAYQLNYSTLDLRQMTHTYQGTWPNRGGTALQHMAHVAQDFGVAVHGLYDVPDEAFHRWGIDEISDQPRPR